MKPGRKTMLITAAALLLAGFALAQNRGFGRRGGRGSFWGGGGGPVTYTEGGVEVDERTVNTAREIAAHSTEPLVWTNSPGFNRDVFTFTRVIYSPARNGSNPRVSYTASGRGWVTDFPDSDLNLSYRVQQMTSLHTDADGRTLRLTNPDLASYPWIYMVEVGRLKLEDNEVPILRRYLLNGGVLMADDFWGQKQWDNFEFEIKRALPEEKYRFIELPMEHPIFHSVFQIKGPKNQLQTPNARQGIWSLNPSSPVYGITWEQNHDDYERPAATRDMHVRAILDDRQRILVIATHNCDNGDGWEREGEDDGFFHEFSEKRAFPLGINIISYLMTH